MDPGFINNVTPRQNFRKAKVIKRYGNRKLYDTELSSYVVLNDIAKMIRNRENVQIIDNQTKTDITSATLTQIIFGAEKKSSVSAPLNILRAIIMRGDGSLSNYLAEIGLYKTKLLDTESLFIGEGNSSLKDKRDEKSYSTSNLAPESKSREVGEKTTKKTFNQTNEPLPPS